ncbi:MAG: FAD-dependent monooxygenase, partial [Rudaea sp.]
MTGKYEAVVVGARVAGAAAAAFLSHAGCRVLLLDRAPVSRPPVSSPIFFANTLHALRRLGMLPRVEALGSPPLRLYQVRLGDIFLRGRMLPYQGIDHAFSIRRER